MVCAATHSTVSGVVIAGHSASGATDVMGRVNAGKSVLVIKPLATMIEDPESLCAMAVEKGVLAAMDARKWAKNGLGEVRGTNRLELQPLGSEMCWRVRPADTCRVKPSTLAAAAHGPAYWQVRRPTR